MRAMIATCFLLGTLAVIHGGSGSSSTANSGGLSEALLLRQNQAAPVYTPGQDYCFMEQYGKYGDSKYCWKHTDSYPVDETWIYIGRGYNSCGLGLIYYLKIDYKYKKAANINISFINHHRLCLQHPDLGEYYCIYDIIIIIIIVVQ